MQKENGLRRFYDYVIACDSFKGKISQMKVVEDFESRPHKAVSLVVEREKGDTGMERAEAAKGATWLQLRKVARKKHRRKKAEKKRSQTRAEKKDKLGAKSPKKSLRAPRRERVHKKMPSRSHKEQLGKGSRKIGTAPNRKRRRRGRGRLARGGPDGSTVG